MIYIGLPVTEPFERDLSGHGICSGGTMPKDAYDILKLLPNTNCGRCGNPSCIALARRISCGRQGPEDCPYIEPGNLGRLKTMMQDCGPSQVPAGKEEAVIELQPCAEYGRVTLEVQLPRPEGSVYDLFDSCHMCTAFRDLSGLDNVKCSLELGYGLAQIEEKRIHVFRSGKITMRRAFDRADALRTLDRVTRALWPSVICECGSTAVECMNHTCPTSREDGLCPAVAWGFRFLCPNKESCAGKVECGLCPEGLRTSTIGKELTEGRKVHPKLEEAMANMAKAVGILNGLGDGKEKALDDIAREVHELLRRSTTGSTDLILDSNDKGMIMGLAAQGVELCVRHIAQGLLGRARSIEAIGPKEKDAALYKMARDLAFRGWDALVRNDLAIGSSVEDAHNAFMTEWLAVGPKGGDVQFLKMADGGVRLARLVRRNIPIW